MHHFEYHLLSTRWQTVPVFGAGILLATLVLMSPGPVRATPSDLPGPARVALAKAARLIQDKAYDQAAEVLQAFQAGGGPFPGPEDDDPRGTHHSQVYFALGTCRLMQNAYGPAITAFEKALQQDPDHVPSWLNLAQAAYGLEDYATAARGFGEAYARMPVPAPSHLYSSAVALLMDRQYASAIAVFEKLFARHAAAAQPAWRENYVHALLSAKRPRQALPHIRALAASSTGTKQIQWQEILLHQYLELGMPQEARNLVLRLTREAPLRDQWWQALTHVALQDNRYEQALMAMTVVGFLRPLSDRETRLVADLQLQVGIPSKAAPLYAAALAHNRDLQLLKNLLQALHQLDRLQEALDACQRFAPDTNDGELLMTRADLLYALERYAEAGQAYRQAARADRSRAGRAWLMAGYAALHIQDMAAGREALARAATFKEQRQAALLAMRRLPESPQQIRQPDQQGEDTRGI